jgi:hypothetical protein
MGDRFPICLADFFAIKVVALLALGMVVFLYWSAFKEKRERRRERQWLENRRRELKEKMAHKP